MTTIALVLATVNAPHKEHLDAQSLAHCLVNHAAAKAVPGHMSSFFGEVEPELQLDFAHQSLQLRLLPSTRASLIHSPRERP
jgi:hypothetical protein